MKVNKVWTTDTEIIVETDDGRIGREKFADYPRLRSASQEERDQYEITPWGVHWENLDEDLCFEGFFKKKEQTTLYKFFVEHPELNASAIARQMGISQTLFAQYISGHKKPSDERLSQIMEHIRKLGATLASV